MTNSYLPASFTGILSWPVRRDDAPESKSDRILTMGIVGGIILLFIVPPTWWFIARTVRLRRARLKGKDVEQGAQVQGHRQSSMFRAVYNYSHLPLLHSHHSSNHQSIITMAISNLLTPLSLVRRKEVEELPDAYTTYIILGICSGITLIVMIVWSIVICCRKRRLRDIEEGHELSSVEASPR
ncbi:uncharacterized protein FTJAE_7430 [Fusarium tjaetaba]|uniref:Uncharacterized protein n=1 Tax=Fusarium tjaetaba TaxID=1567544 RepID=A0A8H5RG02_9HYPO|nr:uncharacterized protein FTJAE_7430 [Fusarium tjaetaba]KAF5632547.1 hypothetical protein FTJAE_7430 [Fusarium tjaetaba]